MGNDDMTYEIVDGGIRCLICERTSYNPADVWNLYCANCKIFHESLMQWCRWMYGEVDLEQAKKVVLA